MSRVNGPGHPSRGSGRSYQREKADRSGKKCHGEKKQNGIDRIPADLLRTCGDDAGQ